MHPRDRSLSQDPSPNEAIAWLHREARRLHRAAASDSLAAALPVLRRVLASGAIRHDSLPEAFRRRDELQRKHLLRTLAVEAGFESWEAWRPALQGLSRADLERTAGGPRDTSQLKLWFRNLAEADAYAATHGGQAVAVGGQAVVLVGEPASHSAPGDSQALTSKQPE